MKIFLCHFFLVYAPVQTFFRNSYYFLLYISFLQTIYFVFRGPANNFFSIFFIPPPPLQKILVRPLLVKLGQKLVGERNHVVDHSCLAVPEERTSL